MKRMHTISLFLAASAIAAGLAYAAPGAAAQKDGKTDPSDGKTDPRDGQTDPKCDESLGYGRVARDVGAHGESCVILDSIIVAVAAGHTVDSAAQQLGAIQGWQVTRKLQFLRVLTAEHSPDDLTLDRLKQEMKSIKANDWAADVSHDALAEHSGATVFGIWTRASDALTDPPPSRVTDPPSSGVTDPPPSTVTVPPSDTQSPPQSAGTSLRESSTPEIEFSDVSPSDWFYDYVQHMAALGVVTGYADGTFRPYENVTRAQMAAYLSRALGGPAAAGGSVIEFSDVSPSDWFYGHVQHMAARGVVTGYADGTFRPYENVTRAQMALFLYRAFDLADPASDAETFADVGADDHAHTAIEALWAAGITTGCDTDPLRYCPAAPINRAQSAAYLSRTISHTGASV